MDRPAQGACALAVDDAHRENPPFPAGREIIRYQLSYLARVKGMQVERTVDGELNWWGLVH
jgi:hypothetical protein